MIHEIEESETVGRRIQSAIFSECVYAQTLANLFGLDKFEISKNVKVSVIPDDICELIKSYFLVPRYVYYNSNRSRMLIQAGSCYGVDSALITVFDKTIYTIEFKEPVAKSSEPDLPKYGEDGRLILTKEFLDKYPQFEGMVQSKIDEGLNFFELIGNNEHDFKHEFVSHAISNNYVKKYADVVCTEDKNGYLTMLPTNQIPSWAKIEGEIRPSGRNHYNVWTPIALKKFLMDKGASFSGNNASISTSKLSLRKERGGGGAISGYKINSIFFVYAKDCDVVDGRITFCIDNVRQLCPTVAGKMSFKTLNYGDVKEYYFGK